MADRDSPKPPAPQPRRDERLAAALRANLKRRKAARRGAAPEAAAEPGDDTTDK